MDKIFNWAYHTAASAAGICETFSAYTGPGRKNHLGNVSLYRRCKILSFLFLFVCSPLAVLSQHQENPGLHYVVSFPAPESHTYQVELQLSKWPADTIRLKMPRWMPGYYQLIDYAKSVENMEAEAENGKTLPVRKVNDHTWVLSGIRNKPVTLRYSIRTDKEFVANSYVDSARAYLVPENTFLYVDGQIKLPVSVKVELNKKWKNIATGLEPVAGRSNEFAAPDFDILYDCPILIGNLQELPSFKVNGIDHRFIGYNIGSFDGAGFMEKLKRIVGTSAALIGDIPYKHYTFIGIGPGQGGIEHLNNTTVSFNGNGLDRPGAMNRIMNFLAHEYFHHYNVKRIRPFELGPFDYENGNRTNLLWVSEGLSVYYEYLVVKRAGLSDGPTLLANLSSNLTAVENNPGKRYQSLQQASYSTWSDGPFGTQGSDPGKSISYYEKGPVVGLLLDFTIRNATGNKSSLDDVMRLLYREYYKEKNRGFTEAEFQAACEKVAGIPLSQFFEYVYTTKEIDYGKYLAYGGLRLEKTAAGLTMKENKQKFVITRLDNPTAMQSAILRSWMGE